MNELFEKVMYRDESKTPHLISGITEDLKECFRQIEIAFQKTIDAKDIEGAKAAYEDYWKSRQVIYDRIYEAEKKMNAYVYENEQPTAEAVQDLESVYNMSFGNIKNATFIKNHKHINEVIADRLREENLFPTITDIATSTGLSRTTVYTHLEYINNDKYRSDRAKQLQMMRGNIINDLYGLATSVEPHLLYEPMTGQKAIRYQRNVKAIDMFLKHTKEKEPTTIKVQNITINQMVISQLPKEKREAIERIILEPVETLELSDIATPPTESL